MEYPFNAICVSSVGVTWANQPLDSCGVYTITSSLTRHVYVGHVVDQPDLTVYLHSTDTVFLKKDTVPDLYRRALKKGLFLPQEYFTEEYNRLFLTKLRAAEHGLVFCFDAEDALKMAMYFDEPVHGLSLKPEVSKKMRESYLHYAEVLEQFEQILKQHKAEHAKDLHDAR